MKKFLFSIMIGLSMTSALACTPGAGNGPSGDPNCMGAILSTDPYYNQGQSGGSAQPTKIIRYTTVKIPSKYGALAVNTKLAFIGSSINMDSLKAAKKAAIKSCQDGNPNVKCEISGWYRNGCIAAASGTKGKNNVLVKAVSEHTGQAEQLALNKCTKAGYSNCNLVLNEQCSLP